MNETKKQLQSFCAVDAVLNDTQDELTTDRTGRSYISMETFDKLFPNRAIYIVSGDAKPVLHFNESEKIWQVKIDDTLYPLFDEEKGLSNFETKDRKPIHYDTKIPVKEGEEPYVETLDGKEVIKFGPNHAYTMPFRSQNGQTYDLMRYETDEANYNENDNEIPVLSSKEAMERYLKEEREEEGKIINRTEQQTRSIPGYHPLARPRSTGGRND